jgi:hypothetical protein
VTGCAPTAKCDNTCACPQTASCWRSPKRTAHDRCRDSARKTAVAGKDSIALRVGKLVNHYKMAKHFAVAIPENSFSFTGNREAIVAEAAPDGIYVLRNNLPTDTLDHADVVACYMALADVEWFFHTLNGELDIRPIRHRLADRVGAHVFLRILSFTTTTNPPRQPDGPTSSGGPTLR